ncbi:hypothetical protein ARMSODRAFT_1003278 [Armillaria solidipes]|uniref:F-box domain-containing protein n=1 Tax=Armillaria solidipes TaxID=1076256 RepID=A0A2H3BIK5_9AGAR|nr:hypothetical protein ARMSODRAFT_1003278 [Armillaria solidipes]
MSYRNCGFVPEPQLQNANSSDSLVSQILRGSRPLLDSDHALLSAEIVELEQQQAIYAAQLEAIQLCRCAVLKALENRKSIYAPIRRLPRDILIEIFDSVCDSWWQEADENLSLRQRRDSLDVSGPLWVLGRVCGVWRDTLHGSPASWARKLVVQAPFSKYAPEILQTYLEHTGEHLLHLYVNCTEPTQGDIILSLLVQSCQRWKNLRINADKSYMPHFESISHFPALQRIDINFYNAHGPTYRSDMCLGAPQLWQASLCGHGIHQMKLPPGITHFSGCITCPEDLHLLSQLRNLRRCHLWMDVAMATKETPVVTVAWLTHLYVDRMDILNFLSAPLLSSLTIGCIPAGPRSSSAQESITCFLRRSRCHLESLSIGNVVVTLNTPPRMSALEACSTVSRLKLELHSGMINGVVEALTSPSVLPNLRHLILCLSRHLEGEWTAILGMVRSRRDAGLLKLVEVQFGVDENWHDWNPAEDIRALSGGDFQIRVEEWDPPSQDHLYLWHLS